MLAVKENRLVVAERLIDLGAPINHQATVSIAISKVNHLFFHIE